MARRSSVHKATGVTPASVAYGKKIQLPINIIFGQPKLKNAKTTKHYGLDYVNALKKKIIKKT